MDSCIRSLTRVLIGTAVTCLLATGASAGILDKPPLINGTEKAKELFLITGVTAEDSELGTFIICTSLDKSDSILAVEVFSEANGSSINDITAGEGVETNVVPGETVTFEISFDTGGIAVTFADEIIDVGTLHHGSARVLSTGKNFICTAGFAESENGVPTSMVQLNVISRKQNGD